MQQAAFEGAKQNECLVDAALQFRGRGKPLQDCLILKKVDTFSNIKMSTFFRKVSTNLGSVSTNLGKRQLNIGKYSKNCQPILGKDTKIKIWVGFLLPHSHTPTRKKELKYYFTPKMHLAKNRKFKERGGTRGKSYNYYIIYILLYILL